MNKLRGEPDTMIQTIPIQEQVDRYGLRPDGSKKGVGFFGQVSEVDDLECYTTELSIWVPGPIAWDLNPGQPTPAPHPQLIPLVVPTLTRGELAHLVAGGDPTLKMKHNAIVHACTRLANGRSPFAQFGEQHPLPED